MSAAPLRIGLAGIGSVGTSVARFLRDHAPMLDKAAGRPLVLQAVSARDRKRDRGINLNHVTWHEDPISLAEDRNVDLVVELMGGADGPALALAVAALQNNKPLVTGNKAMLSRHGATLSDLVTQHNGVIGFEASVAGGIPAIKTLREGLAANDIISIAGILNGTCNFILSTMAATGRSFDDVLAEAQKLGYAEADPSFDIDGVDTAHKLSILAALAFGGVPDIDGIDVSGIRSVTGTDISAARNFGFAIKLLGIATPHVKKVAPVLVPLHTPIAGVQGAMNTVSIRGDYAGPITLTGAGAGGDATASAVIADIVDIARGHRLPLFNDGKDSLSKGRERLSLPARFYLRADSHADKVFGEIEKMGIALPQRQSGLGAALTELMLPEKLLNCLAQLETSVFHLQIEENF